MATVFTLGWRPRGIVLALFALRRQVAARAGAIGYPRFDATGSRGAARLRPGGRRLLEP